MVLLPLIGLELESEVDLAQEEPGAQRARDQIRVLALPADAGALGERLFHHRRGVDKYLEIAAPALRDEPGERLQPRLHDVVVIATARVDGDRPALGLGERGERVL